jgi:nucleotide-binding universal stress UspA family protein
MKRIRILVAIDGSDAANRAVELAARLTKALEGQLKIIHVISLDNLPLEELSDYGLREHATLGDVLNTFAEEKLTAARQRAEALGASTVQSASPIGDIAESIIDAARQDEVDMIILGKRGRGRLSGLILGSVSQKVVTVGPCAVIVVP